MFYRLQVETWKVQILGLGAVYLRTESSFPKVKPMGILLTAREWTSTHQSKPVWGRVFDFCNTQQFWVFDFCNTQQFWVFEGRQKKRKQILRTVGSVYSKNFKETSSFNVIIWFFFPKKIVNCNYITIKKVFDFVIPVIIDQNQIFEFWITLWLSTLIPDLIPSGGLVQFLIPTHSHRRP